MKIAPASKILLSLESAALTDIIMNLFIFFFISFSLLYTFNPTNQSEIQVNLPKGTHEMEPSKGPAIVSITKDNSIYFNSEKVDLENLSRSLSRDIAKTKETGLVIMSDKDASVDTLVKVLDTSRAAGISKLGISIEIVKPVD